jgi:hypothetical protein
MRGVAKPGRTLSPAAFRALRMAFLIATHLAKIV